MAENVLLQTGQAPQLLLSEKVTAGNESDSLKDEMFFLVVSMQVDI